MNRKCTVVFAIANSVAIVTILLLGFLATPSAFGQADTGSIAGVVRDPSGGVLPNATVVATSAATAASRTVQTTADGAYTIPTLIPGIYNVQVTASGFQPFNGKAEVTVGAHVTLDAQLSVSNQSETVEVVAAGGTAVNTQTQELSQVINSQQIAELPSLTRNPYDFVALSGNVSSGDITANGGSPNGSGASVGTSATGRGVGYSVNGQRESGTEILLDGVENIQIFSYSVGQPVPVDTVQEYSVITNNFSSEYGRASGGVVNVSSKSGTNDFHGSAWEFNRLSAYTANTFGNDAKDLPKGVYTRNQFGFDGGGPIKKNKLFIFEGTEWTRVRSSANITNDILDPSFISMLPANVQNYFTTYGTGALRSSSTVTAGQLAAAGLTINPINGVTPVPASQPIFDVVNYSVPFDAGGSVPQNTYSLLGRIDYNLNDKTQMFFRAARDTEDQFQGAVFQSPYPQYDAGAALYNQSYLFSINHVLNSSMLNNFKASFSRFNDGTSYNTALTNTPNLFLSASLPTDPVTGNAIQLPGLENSSPGNGGLPAGGPQNTLQFEDDFTWTRGKHNLHFGGQFTYIQLNYAYGAYAQAVEELGATLPVGMNSLVNAGGNAGGSPVVTFTARVAPGVLPCPVDQFGNLIESSSCAVTPPLPSADYARSYRYKDWAVYAQDSFRLTNRLTINYGLRYEHYGVQHNNHQDLDSNFYPGTGSSFYGDVRNGQVLLTQKSPVGQFWSPSWGTAAPRIGFAYDVFGDGKTSLRGGFGISYERNFGNVTYNASFNPPGSATLNDVCAAANSLVTGCPYLVTSAPKGPLGEPGPATFLPPVELRDDNAYISVAQTQFWSLALQRQVANNTIVELSYSGAHGVHLYDLDNINLPGAGQVYLGDPLVTGAACANSGFVNTQTGVPECLTRPDPQYSNINLRGSFGSSAYDALNVKFQTQNLHNTGLTLVANYTWAHSLDDLSSTFSDSLQGGSDGIGSLGYTDLLNPKLDWASSDYDIRNRIAISPIWETPWFKSGRGIETEALGGWMVADIFTARSGVPFSAFDYTYDENFYTVPRLVPSTPITSFHTGTPQLLGPNLYSVMTLPIPANTGPFNTALGISDFGPFPSNMLGRNTFRGPGAWNDDLAISKNFKLTERFNLQFRAEGFNVFNHHNLYVNPSNLDYSAPSAGSTYTPLPVTAEKGGLGTIAIGGNHDERRFGQFALRLMF
jgi:carboxypeptidase family protein